MQVSYSTVLNAARSTFAKLAAMAGSTLQIEVTANGGKTASVIWRGAGNSKIVIVNLPTLPPGHMMERNVADRMVAYIVHELGHVLYSDKQAWDAAQGDAFLFQVINGLEDPRMERAVVDGGTIPNAAGLFLTLGEHLAMDAVKGNWQAKVAGDLPFAFAIWGRAVLGNRVPSLAALKVSATLRPVLDFGLAGLPACKSTADVVALARKIVAMVRQAGQQAGRQAGQQGDGQQGQQGQQGQPGDGQQGQQDGQQGQQDGQQDGQQGQQDGQQDGQQGQQDGQQGQQDDGQPGDGKAGPGKSGSEAFRDENVKRSGDASIEDMAKRLGLSREASPSPYLNGLSGWAPGNKVSARATHRADYGIEPGKRIAQMVPTPTVLKGQIRRMLRANERISNERFLTAGRLDRRALSRMSAGSLNVYTRREEVPGVNTAVGLLIDTSGSMGGELRDACCMALHLAEACQDAGADVMLGQFGTGETGKVLAIKEWSEGKPQITRGVGNMAVSGGTPLSPCMMTMVDELARRPNATRRILFALTDGDCNYGPTGVKWACDYGRGRGVEVIGVSLGATWASRGFRYGVTVQNAQDLTGSVLKELAAQLDRAAARRG